MEIEVLADAPSVAERGAQWLAEQARDAIAARGRFVLGVSGGGTPWLMFRALATEDVDWNAVEIVQVDERMAPAGDPDRNLTHLRACLRAAPGAAERIHAMPVESADVSAAADAYARELETLAGSPPVLDVVHLGLGPDGHTASLVPGDPVLRVQDAEVALTGEYNGRRRMTLTYPVLNRARRILWVVTGPTKVDPLRRMRKADPSIPAGRIRQTEALLLADQAAVEKSRPD